MLLISACARPTQPPGHPAAITPGNGAAAGTINQTAAAVAPLGTVDVIGTGKRFVLIQTPTAQFVTTLSDGQALVCRDEGNVTAFLHVSHERRPPFIVADVAAGEPHVGDEVFIDTDPGRVVLPKPAIPLPISSPGPDATPEFHVNPALPLTR